MIDTLAVEGEIERRYTSVLVVTDIKWSFSLLFLALRKMMAFTFNAKVRAELSVKTECGSKNLVLIRKH